MQVKNTLAGRSEKAEPETSTNTEKFFSFLFTMDNTHIEGPLSLFQTTIYRRDYNRDRDELVRLTDAVLQIFGQIAKDDKDLRDLLLIKLVAKLRELHFLPFREILPELEQQARLIIQAVDDLDPMLNRVQALSAILSLHRLLEDRRREMEVICPPSQFMFFERLVELLVTASRGLEQAISKGSETYCRLTEQIAKLRLILEAAVEPLVPLLDDAWRYSLYSQYELQQDAYRKQKLLLIHPLESTLKRAVLDDSRPKDNRPPGRNNAKDNQGDNKPNEMHMLLKPKHLLSPMEKRLALRSYWTFDRTAAYIHYSEDRSRPNEEELEKTLMELTRAVLKEIALLEVPLPIADAEQEPDDLPLRFALRALLSKVKIGIGYGRHTPDGGDEVMASRSEVRKVIEDRIKAETGLSFAGIKDLLKTLRKLQNKLDSPSPMDLNTPIASLCDDFERILREPGNAMEAATARTSEASDFEGE